MLIVEPGESHQEMQEFIVANDVDSVMVYTYFYNSEFSPNTQTAEVGTPLQYMTYSPVVDLVGTYQRRRLCRPVPTRTLAEEPGWPRRCGRPSSRVVKSSEVLRRQFLPKSQSQRDRRGVSPKVSPDQFHSPHGRGYLLAGSCKASLEPIQSTSVPVPRNHVLPLCLQRVHSPA